MVVLFAYIYIYICGRRLSSLGNTNFRLDSGVAITQSNIIPTMFLVQCSTRFVLNLKYHERCAFSFCLVYIIYYQGLRYDDDEDDDDDDDDEDDNGCEDEDEDASPECSSKQNLHAAGQFDNIKTLLVSHSPTDAQNAQSCMYKEEEEEEEEERREKKEKK